MLFERTTVAILTNTFYLLRMVLYTPNYLKTPWTLFSADNKLKTILMQICWGQSALREWKSGIILIYYSFKIFSQSWLAKSTRVIHHNQPPMNKFGIILCLTRKWRQKCSPLQVKASLPRRLGDEIELFWLWKKNGGHFTRFKSKNYRWIYGK